MITIRKFEAAIVKYLNLTAPALDKRNRALKTSGLILHVPGRKGAIPVMPADAAYVILVAVSNAKLEEVVEAVKRLGGLVPDEATKIPPGFETLHGALTEIILERSKISVNRVMVEPHSCRAEVDIEINTDDGVEVHKIQYGLSLPDTDLTIARSSHIQHEFVIRGVFFDIVVELLGNVVVAGLVGGDSLKDFKGRRKFGPRLASRLQYELDSLGKDEK